MKIPNFSPSFAGYNRCGAIDKMSPRRRCRRRTRPPALAFRPRRETFMSRVPPPLPVMLDLAPLPRTQVGPFLLLGLDKDADKDTLEANWAQRLIWARKNQTKAALEDINWAREILSEYERRVRA